MRNRLTLPMMPTCPADMPQEVRAEFDRLMVLMAHRTKPEDGYTIAMFAVAWTTWRRAMDDVHKLGNVVMSGGTAIANPSLAIAAQAHNQLLALAREMGLTATSRKRLKLDAKPQRSANGGDWFAPEESKTG